MSITIEQFNEELNKLSDEVRDGDIISLFEKISDENLAKNWRMVFKKCFGCEYMTLSRAFVKALSRYESGEYLREMINDLPNCSMSICHNIFGALIEPEDRMMSLNILSKHHGVLYPRYGSHDLPELVAREFVYEIRQTLDKLSNDEEIDGNTECILMMAAGVLGIKLYPYDLELFQMARAISRVPWAKIQHKRSMCWNIKKTIKNFAPKAHVNYVSQLCIYIWEEADRTHPDEETLDALRGLICDIMRADILIPICGREYDKLHEIFRYHPSEWKVVKGNLLDKMLIKRFGFEKLKYKKRRLETEEIIDKKLDDFHKQLCEDHGQIDEFRKQTEEYRGQIDDLQKNIAANKP